jgi:hypothetical protein
MASTYRPLAALAAVLGLTVTSAAAQRPGAVQDSGATTPPEATATAAATSRCTVREVGGKALRVRVEEELRCHEDVPAGTLLLREDGRWRLETTVRETCGSRVRMDQDDEDGIYHVEGAKLRFLDDDGHRNRADWSLRGKIDLDDLDQGTLTDGGVLTVRLADGETVLHFRRVGA